MELTADAQGIEGDSKDSEGNHSESEVIETKVTSWNRAVQVLKIVLIFDCSIEI